MTYETVLIDAPDPALIRVTLNRPDAMNALNTRMAEELRDLFRGFATRAAGELRAVVLTGAGDRAFCAGADLKERHGMTDEAWRRQHVVFEEAGAALACCPAPVIAAINGVALGGGCEIAMTCDFIIAADSARFGQPESLRGIVPGLGGTQRLPRRIGTARALELLFTGRLIGAEEALRWGLVNRVVAPDDLGSTVLDVARRIGESGPLAVRAIKRAVLDGADRPLGEALATELRLYNQVIESNDRHEGIRAFNEKRPPRFTGR